MVKESNMFYKDRIETLEAQVEKLERIVQHLQDNVDSKRDKLYYELREVIKKDPPRQHYNYPLEIYYKGEDYKITTHNFIGFGDKTYSATYKGYVFNKDDAEELYKLCKTLD